MTTKKSKSEDPMPAPLPPQKVILDRPGVLACGPYRAGQVYEVGGKEAERLIRVKGFRPATEADMAPPTVNPAQEG